MQLQLLKLCTFLSGVAELSIPFNKFNFQKSLKGTWKCLGGHFFAPGPWFGHPWYRPKINCGSCFHLAMVYAQIRSKNENESAGPPWVGCRCACHVLLSKRLVETENFERRKRKIANKSLKKLKGYQTSIPTVTVKAKESLVYVSEAFI